MTGGGDENGSLGVKRSYSSGRRRREEDEEVQLDREESRLEHPLEVGLRAACLLGDAGDGSDGATASGELFPCEIVERKEVKRSAETGTSLIGWEYYVHLVNSDRRLDQWVEGSSLFPEEFAKKPDKEKEEDPSGDGGGKITRHKRRMIEQLNPTSQKETGNRVIEELEKAREEQTKVKNIGKLVFGDYEISTWYFSPYPREYSSLPTLYTCAFCLKYMRLIGTYVRHTCNCKWQSPPGVQIYFDRNPGSENDTKRGPIKVFEVDGMLSPLYCQNLCLLAKLFLDHKTLCFDVPPFMFYVVTEQNKAGGWELVGFFSKEKGICGSEYNVACILVLPNHQRKGYGKFLIALSYELTKREGKTATPERPLSDLGQVSYRSFWTREVLQELKRRRSLPGVTARDVATATGVLEKDVCQVLKSLGMLRIWKGEHMVSTNLKAVDDAYKKLPQEGLVFRQAKLRWQAHPGAAPPKQENHDEEDENDNPEPQSSTMRTNLTNSTSAIQTTITSKEKASSDALIPLSSPTTTTTASISIPTDDAHTRTPKDQPPVDKNKKVAPHRFTLAEVQAMRDFVLEHGIAKVRAPMNSPEGLPRLKYEEFSKKLNIDYSRCKEKIKRMAGDMMVKESGSTTTPATTTTTTGTTTAAATKTAGESAPEAALPTSAKASTTIPNGSAAESKDKPTETTVSTTTDMTETKTTKTTTTTTTTVANGDHKDDGQKTGKLSEEGSKHEESTKTVEAKMTDADAEGETKDTDTEAKSAPETAATQTPSDSKTAPS